MTGVNLRRAKPHFTDPCWDDSLYDSVRRLFEDANYRLVRSDKSLFDDQASERTLCGALMIHLHDVMARNKVFSGYYADVEYNRNKGSIKTYCKTIEGSREQIIRINCDLIVHSRGEITRQDNLLAVEMKKSTRPNREKEKDRERLIALTRSSFDDTWAWDGKNLPEHVCRYIMGVYYEINHRKHLTRIEYYRQGELLKTYEMKLGAL